MFRAPAALWGRLPFVGRLLVIASLALLAAASAMLYTVAREDAEQARRDMARAMRDHLAILPATLGEWIVVGDFSVLKKSMDRYVAQDDVVFVTYHAAGDGTLVSKDVASKGDAPEWFRHWFDVPDSTGSAAVTIGERNYGTLEVGLTARTAVDHAWTRLLRHLAILVLAIVLGFLGIWLVLRNGLKPLRRLHEGARRLQAGDFSRRLDPGGGPELRGVMAAFNDMAETLASDRALLAREKEYLQVTLSSIADGVIATDAKGAVEFMNSTAEALTGWQIEQARGRLLSAVFEIIDADSRDKLACPVVEVLSQGGAVGLTENVLLIQYGNGTERYIAVIAAPIRDEQDGVILGAVLVVRDQTERKAQEYRLNLLASVVEHASESVVITNPETVIIDVNQAFTEVTGYTRDEALGQTPSLLKSGRHDQAFYERLWQALKTESYWHGEIFNRRKDGEIFVEMGSISAVRNARGAVTHYFGLFTDITQLKDQQKQLERLAYYDVLTGLPNRRLVADRFDIALSQTRRGKTSLAVCYLDLDNFKEVNDQFGHGAGDHLLVEVAERLKVCIRGGDTIARFGGDEFVLVLVGLNDAVEVERVLGRILDSLSAPYAVATTVVKMSASIGVALYPNDVANDLDSLLRLADQAMYTAKQAGRNRWHVFDMQRDRVAQELHDRRESIVRAVNLGEFRLYYQPKVNMRTGEVVGAEALIRWQHPDRGLLPPAEFLPMIQDSELAIAVGDWVIGEALFQMDTWRQLGLRVPVSVNISAQQMQHALFVVNLARQLESYPELAAGMIEVEVLESSALDDIARASAVIKECRQLGVTVALDDFGTGYSSLTYLRRLPVSTIKIDQTFVREMLINQDDTAIVEGVISLASAFRRDVIAEGVETVEHGVLLLQMGCELAQGYGIARPMPGDSMPAWLATWRPDAAWMAASAEPWPQEDLPLLYASVAHRHWVNLVLARLAGPDGLAPYDIKLDDETACAFGRWYDGRGRQRYGHMEGFRTLEPLHRNMHTLGAELVALNETRPGAAQPRVDELVALRDRLLAVLGELRTGSEGL
jgi:diguanylate cyclase (GGDEF)-like protein/PAS domain S-box-containing protein